jgi:hypothetical protein
MAQAGERFAPTSQLRRSGLRSCATIVAFVDRSDIWLFDIVE